MLDLLKKTYLVGLGFASLTREKVEEVVDELVRKGEVAEKDRKQVFEDLMAKAKEEQQRFSQSVKETVQKVVREIGGPSKQAFEDLVKRVEDLEGHTHSSEESEPENDSSSENS